MSDIDYVPIIKTGDAEIRGLENLLDEVKSNITPLIVLTPSRKSKKKPEGDIFRRLARFKEAFDDREFILDLIADPNLTNRQIENLQNNHDGYVNWIDFLVSLQDDFSGITPVIQISDIGVDSQGEYYKRIKQQVTELGEYFEKVVYRFPLEYEDFSDDLDEICSAIDSDRVICVVDASFITQEKSSIYSPMATNVVNELIDYSFRDIVLTATSFPKNPTEFGGDKYGEFELEECNLYEEVVDGVETELVYGDYATINPIRSLQAGGRGWVPRIDLPTEDAIFYHRSRRSNLETSYANAYVRVAELVYEDERYESVRDEITGGCWGTGQIEMAADGYPPGLSPAFWISVRMNIHMTVRKKLSLG